jgi:hypothetical protein
MNDSLKKIRSKKIVKKEKKIASSNRWLKIKLIKMSKILFLT